MPSIMCLRERPWLLGNPLPIDNQLLCTQLGGGRHTVAEEELGSKNIIVPLEIAFLESFTHDDFGLPFCVHFGSVEEVDSMIPCFLQTGSCLFDFFDSLVTAVCEPSS